MQQHDAAGQPQHGAGGGSREVHLRVRSGEVCALVPRGTQPEDLLGQSRRIRAALRLQSESVLHFEIRVDAVRATYEDHTAHVHDAQFDLDPDRPPALTSDDLMTSPVLTVSADELVEDVVKRLAFHEIGGMPVEDWDGTIIGMVSQSDVIDKLGVVVRDVMQTALVSVKPGMSIDQVAAVMAENQIKRVPVLDGNRLLGIISRADIVRAMAESVPVAG